VGKGRMQPATLEKERVHIYGVTPLPSVGFTHTSVNDVLTRCVLRKEEYRMHTPGSNIAAMSYTHWPVAPGDFRRARILPAVTINEELHAPRHPPSASSVGGPAILGQASCRR